MWSAGRGAVADDHTDVQYRLGSITKTITAITVLRLRDAGALALGDPLERHLPGTPLGDRTLGQLLSHLGGAGSESPGGWWERTPGTTLDGLGLTGADVVLPAARRFHYSNLGFGLLGELVARARGRAWPRSRGTRCPAARDHQRPRPPYRRRGRRHRRAPLGRRGAARARARRRCDGPGRSALGHGDGPRPARRVPAGRHRRRALPPPPWRR